MSIKIVPGQVFNRWTVVAKGSSKNGSTYWRCVCECGTEKEVARRSLLIGMSKSCGCLASELSSDRMKTDKMQASRAKHNLRGTREYDILAAMKSRCYNKNDPNYYRYGARGITICDRWLESVTNFVEDMGLKPEGLSLDRIDNDKGYCKENCRWATASEQRYNSSTSVRFEYKGELCTVQRLSEISGLSVQMLRDRLVKLKWPVDKAVESTAGQPTTGRAFNKVETDSRVKIYKD